MSAQLKELAMSGDLSIAVALKGRQIGTYVSLKGKQVIRKEISLWIGEMSQSFNIGKNLTEDQIVDIANEIMNEKWFFKVDEIYYFLRKCKIGAFGKVYDRLDMATIFEWLEIYTKQRDAEMDRQRDLDKPKDMTLFLIEGLKKRFPDADYLKPKNGNSIKEKLSDPDYQDWKSKQKKEDKLNQAWEDLGNTLHEMGNEETPNEL